MRHLLSAVLSGAVLIPSLAHAQSYGPPTPPARPLHTFISSFYLRDDSMVSVGNGTGASLEVTSLTFSNATQTTQSIQVAQVATDGQSCSAAATLFGKVKQYFFIPAQQTVHLVFPTPLDIGHFQGVSCLSFEVSGDLNNNAVYVLVNGFSQ